MSREWGANCDFEPARLQFEPGLYRNIFRHKNNKTVAETLGGRKYATLRETAQTRYGGYLDWPLGEFLFHLKENGDGYYKRFLNRYGDLEYTRFRLSNSPS